MKAKVISDKRRQQKLDAAKRYRTKHKARALAASKLWRDKNKAHVKAYNDFNAVHRNILARARYRKNPAKGRAAVAKWRAKNPDYSFCYRTRNKARFIGNGTMSYRSLKTRRAWRKFSGTQSRFDIAKRLIGANKVSP